MNPADTEERELLQSIKCDCGRRIGGLESFKGGEKAEGVDTGRVVSFRDGRLYIRCRCKRESPMPLEVRVIFPT